MSVFQFKQFNVLQARSSMKVGTDSVVLGCLCEVDTAKQVLDIGTGTGLLSLMVAQRNSNCTIDAVEINADAATEAKQNINNSKWNDRITLYNKSIQEYAVSKDAIYDLVICNPPYFEVEKSYAIASQARTNARQTQSLSFDELINCVQKLLTNEGSFWMILPTQEAQLFLAKASDKLYLTKQILIYPKPNKIANRVVLQLKKSKGNTLHETITLYTEQGLPDEAYKNLTREFYTGNQFQ